MYRNLQKDCFSIRKQGIVVQHSAFVMVENPRFIVSEAGRSRVLQERRKNVHAVVRGEFGGTKQMSLKDFKEGHYNPYEQDYFMDKKTKGKLETANKAYLVNKKLFYL